MATADGLEEISFSLSFCVPHSMRRGGKEIGPMLEGLAKQYTTRAKQRYTLWLIKDGRVAHFYLALQEENDLNGLLCFKTGTFF